MFLKSQKCLKINVTIVFTVGKKKEKRKRNEKDKLVIHWVGTPLVEFN